MDASPTTLLRPVEHAEAIASTGFERPPAADPWPVRDAAIAALAQAWDGTDADLSAVRVTDLVSQGCFRRDGHGGNGAAEVALPTAAVGALERWLLERILCATESMSDRLFVDRLGRALTPAEVGAVLDARP